MVFDEDRNRTRKDHGPENLALQRRLAVSVLSNAKSCPGSIRTKQLHALLDDQVLEKMLTLSPDIQGRGEFFRGPPQA
jgi:hypothetical protein